jgi:hypothetical protein
VHTHYDNVSQCMLVCQECVVVISNSDRCTVPVLNMPRDAFRLSNGSSLLRQFLSSPRPFLPIIFGSSGGVPGFVGVVARTLLGIPSVA